MSDSIVTSGRAWQPVTPRGVAAFAAAPLGRLLLVQLAVAVVLAAGAAWFVSVNWLPVARQAINHLPPGACVRGGLLRWTTNSPVRLAENRFLALVVDARDTGAVGRVADLEIAFHDTHFTAASLFGCLQWKYPTGWIISLDPSEAVPWWGAWEGPLRAILAGVVVIGLLLLWWLLATLYCPAVWALARFLHRRPGLWASWKLSGAALLPGALVILLGLISYGALGMDLIRAGLFFLLHLVTGWVYLLASPYFLANGSAPQPENPFAPPGCEPSSRRDPKNPFAAP